MKRLGIILMMLAIIWCGCSSKSGDERIHVREGIGSDTLASNIVTRPVARAFSVLIGEGIQITKATTIRNDAGFMEVHVEGFNNSYNTKRFRYRVEWLDSNGFVLETKTSVWLPMSTMGKSPFSFKVVSPRTEAVDFRMDTRKWE
jgi:uncharacterized protein YcfL